MVFMATLRPRGLAVAFGGYHLLIFLLAWLQAKDLPGPWYDAAISQQVYFAYFLAAGALLAGLVGAMVARTNFLDRRIAAFEDRGALVPMAGGVENPGEAVVEAAPPKDRVDKDIDDLLESLSEMETTAVEVELEESGLGAPYSAATPADASAARDRLEGMRRSVRGHFVGPAAVAILFLGICGAMLPGTGGFLQTYHQLNTTLILGLGYGWLGLGGYVIAAVLGLLREGPR